MVVGTANIYGVCHAIAPAPAGLGGGTLPVLVAPPLGSARTMTVTDVSGMVDYDGPNPLPSNGAYDVPTSATLSAR